MSDPSSDVGKLESAALARKARLAKLKADKEKKSGGGTNEDKSTELPKPLFRSYQPDSEQLKDSVIPEAQPGDVADHVQEEISKEKDGLVVNELDFMNLAPRKPDWDLKRDVAPKLDKLERRTQKAIAELIRERLKEEDLANAVTAGASAAEKIAQHDD